MYVAQSGAEASEAVEQAPSNDRTTLRLRHDMDEMIDGVVPAQPFPDEPS